MSITDHIDCFLLSVLLHVLGILLTVTAFVHAIRAEDAALKPELADTGLTLISIESVSSSDPAAGQTPAAGQCSAQNVEPEAPPPLQSPQPAEPVPLPDLPEKPSFADALTPPPEPPPEPTVAPKPTPIPTRQPASAAAPTSVPATSHAPVATTEKTTQGPATGGDSSQQTTLQSAGGGGGYGRIDAHPSLEQAIKPSYPIGARRRGEEGTVVLDVTVNPKGRASDVRLVSSCGFSELDNAAQRAAGQARFKPGTSNGQPVESAARLTIIFRLHDQ